MFFIPSFNVLNGNFGIFHSTRWQLQLLNFGKFPDAAPLSFKCFTLLTAFDTPAKMTTALMAQEVDGILIDNYALTRFSNWMEKEPIRVERTIEHPITYGLVLPTGSPITTQCVRRYMTNFDHEIFDNIAKHLKPVKVSTSV